MKILLAIIAAATVGSAATYLVVKKAEPAKQTETRSPEMPKGKVKPERTLLTGKAKAARGETTEPKPAAVAPAGLSAEEIIEELIQFKPAAEKSRNASTRRLIHRFESLNDMGPAALPAIEAFLAKNKDVEFQREGGPSNEGDRGRDRGGDRGGPPPWAAMFGGASRMPDADSLYPASLRLGLFEVARQIGGTEAEEILADVLSQTARGIEVAHLARVLDEMAPGKYRDRILAAARELLSNPPPAGENPSRLDEMGRQYLFSLLSKYQDKSFADKAQEMLVSADGRVNNSALNYLTETLKDQSLPLLYKVYKDPTITNNLAKVPVISAALNYVGQHPQADAMFKEIMLDEKNAAGRWMVVGSLTRGDNLTPETIKARQQLLTSMKPDIKDERMTGMMDRVNQELERRLDPNAPPREGGGLGSLIFGGRGGGPPGEGNESGGGRSNRDSGTTGQKGPQKGSPKGGQNGDKN